jgi:octaprenyl-diphosphate synthase
MKVMEILADTTNLIAEGEVMQLINCHDPDTTEQRYRRVIYCKTAKLFETAARLGAVLASLAPDAELALTHYGAHLGMVYQLVDDVLDYRTPSEQLGKNIGDDLAEGKPTLPLIHAMRAGSPSEVELIREAIRQGGLENMTAVVDAIESTGAITYTVRGAREEAERAIEALSGLPESPAKEALCGLVEFSLARTY